MTAEDNKTLAAEIARRRLGLWGAKFSQQDALSEVLFLSKYGIVPTIDSLTDSMMIVVKDAELRKVQLVPAAKRGLSIGVDELEKTTEVVVFLQISAKKIVGGWTTSQQVQDAPLEGGNYHLSREALASFPEQFIFRTSCPGVPCDHSAVWDNERVGWLCFGCDRLRYDEGSRQKFGVNDEIQFEYPVTLGVSWE